MLAYGFLPLEGDSPRILILGSIPGIGSIDAQEYYHDGSNRIWKVLAFLVGCSVPNSYSEKKAMLFEHRMALWDYYHNVERHNSSDKAITSGTPNDIQSYLEQHPSIRIIAVNGYGKYKSFGAELERICCALNTGIKVLRLPETSGLNAAWTLDKLKAKWRIIMFENEIDALHGHIEFLTNYLEGAENVTLADELHEVIDTAKRDIEKLRSELPYDEIEEDDIPIEDFGGELFSDSDIEDEVVQAEAVIRELEELILRAEADESYDSTEEASPYTSSENAEDEDMFWDQLQVWIRKWIVIFCDRDRKPVPSSSELDRLALAISICSLFRMNYRKAFEYAQAEFPDDGYTEEEIRRADLSYYPINHVSLKLICRHEVQTFIKMDFAQEVDYHEKRGPYSSYFEAEPKKIDGPRRK